MSVVYDWSIPIARIIDPQTVANNIYDIFSKHLQYYEFELSPQLNIHLLELGVGVLGSILGNEIYDKYKERKETKKIRKELFPFLKSNSETVIGPRDPNTLKPSKENLEDALKLKIPKLFSSCLLKSKTGEKVAGKIVKTITVEDLTKGFQTNDKENIIKYSNVNGIGGPVPLPLVGWVMYNRPFIQYTYAPNIRTFYKGKKIEQLDESNLLKLKKLKKNWYIERKDGNLFSSNGKKRLIPHGDRGGCYYDYCLIQKLPMNVLPGGDSKKHLYLFSGPHWEGTRGAVEALSDYKVLSNIKKAIEDDLKTKEDKVLSENTFFEVALECEYNHENNKIKFGVEPEDVHIIKM